MTAPKYQPTPNPFGTISFTLTFGLQIGPWHLFSYSEGYAFDRHGNIAHVRVILPGTGATGGAAKVSIVAGLNVSLSNANSVVDLSGLFADQSIMVGDGLGVGVNSFEGQSSAGNLIAGGGLTLGFAEGSTLDSAVTDTFVDVENEDGGGPW